MKLICRKLHQIIEMRHFVQVVFDINQVEYQVPLKTINHTNEIHPTYFR